MRSATFVTARLASSRLPEKVLADLGGRPAIELLITRLATATRPEAIVLCTTDDPTDDILLDVAARLGIEAFRGSAEDILDRWLGAARSFDVDFLVNCDADDIFCDPVHVDRVIEHHERTGAEYVTCAGLPFGAAPTGLATAALARVCARKTDHETQGQGRFFTDERLVSQGRVVAPPELRCDEARMTLDYPEDLEFFRAVVADLGTDPEQLTLAAVVGLLQRRPDIVAINAGLQEEYWTRFNAMYPPVELQP